MLPDVPCLVNKDFQMYQIVRTLIQDDAIFCSCMLCVHSRLKRYKSYKKIGLRLATVTGTQLGLPLSSILVFEYSIEYRIDYSSTRI